MALRRLARVCVSQAALGGEEVADGILEAHAYASRSGVYRPLTCWERTASRELEGMIELPMAVGIVGGATRTHPMAGLLLRMMYVEPAAELGMVIAVTGLAGNRWNLRTLAAGGLQAEFVPSLERRRGT